MKKLFAAILVVAMLAAAAAIPTYAAEDFPYAHIVASGNDPYASFEFSSEGGNTSIDPDTVKWAAIKYRTVTETDSTGVQLIGQLYICPAVEPFVPLKYEHTQQWEILVVDLTSVSEKTQLPSAWNSGKYTDTSKIRFDPLESNRDAEAQDGDNDVARVEADSAIDIAFIAFFTSEEDARAYDGTQDTPYCLILPADLEWFKEDHAIADIETVSGKKPAAETAAETETEAASEEESEEATEAPAETTAETATESAAETAAGTAAESAADTAETSGDESQTAAGTEKPEETTGNKDGGEESKGFPGWSIAIIAAAGALLVAAVIVIVAKNKKK